MARLVKPILDRAVRAIGCKRATPTGMAKAKFVILGGGMVAGYAAKELMENGLKPGELTIISAEAEIPYERPPLSKGYLAGKESEEKIRINGADKYREKGVELKLGVEVKGVDTRARTLRVSSGEDLEFEKLVIATGAEPVTLTLPDIEPDAIY